MSRTRSPRRARGLVLSAVAVLGLATALWLPTRNDTADAAVGPVVWSDEFDGSGAFDSSKWTAENGASGWGNNELQYYTGRSENVRKENGNLVIEARAENYNGAPYTSARLITSNKFAQTYGRMEARIKIPRGQGIWPAFWMLGQDIGSVGWPNSGEIDIMENVGKEPNTVYGTVHGPGYSGGAGITGSRNIGRPLADDYHTYGVEWSPNLIRWLLDGAEYHRITPASLPGTWVFNKPNFLILNVAVGGNWPGYPDGTTQMPQRMLVDWVRVNSWNNTPAGQTITGPGRKCVDVAGDDTGGDGAAVQLWDCQAGARDQRWTRNGQTLQTLGRCLDIAGGTNANGTRLQLANCNGGGYQNWVTQSDGSIRNPTTGRCIDSPGGATGNGTRLQIYDCNGAGAQKFAMA